MRRSVFMILVLLALAVGLSACAAPANNTPVSAPAAAQAASLPQPMQDAPARVRASYQFAVTNPDALKNVPCYCGCGSMGHTSNLSCYVKDGQANGQIAFDDHTLGCSLCVDIAQDVMRMTGEHKAPVDIRAAILAAYSKFGPGNQ